MYTLAVVGTLAVVIGANTAVFSVLQSVLLQPFPYEDDASLVVAYRDWSDFSWRRGPMSFPNFRDWRRADLGLVDLAAFSEETYTYLGETSAESWKGIEITTNLLPLLAVQPAIGQWFEHTDDLLAAEPVVLLSHGTWQRVFGSDPGVVGREISLGEAPRTIAGVMPAEFAFPSSGVDFWVPLPDHDYVSERGTGFLTAVGRLEPGMQVETYAQRLAVAARRIDIANSRGNLTHGVFVESLRDAVVGDVRRMFWVAMAAVAAVFAIACANLTNLALAQGTQRAREFTIRGALGAGRAALLRQLTAESLIVASVGGLLGIPLALWTTRAFVSLSPPEVPRLANIAVNGQALLFTLVVTFVAALAIGLTPAAATLRDDAASSLRGATRTTLGPGGRRMQQGLVVAQMALTTVLLATAGLLSLSFYRMATVDPGLSPGQVIAAAFELEGDEYESRDAVDAFYRELGDRVANHPDVTRLSFTSSPPFSGTNHYTRISLLDHVVANDEDAPPVRMATVDENYFGMLGVRVAAGRAFDGREHPGDPPTTVINTTMARTFWPGENPIGKQFEATIDDPVRTLTVIGVVHDTLHGELVEDPAPMFYRSRRTDPAARYGYLMVESTGDPADLAPSIRAALVATDPRLPVAEVNILSRLVDRTLREPRFRAVTLGLFALMAVVIALVGVYSLLSFVVGQRRHEIGVRLAVGASQANVFRQVAGHGLGLAGGGLAVGTMGAVGATRLLDSLLYGVTPYDPATLIGTNLILAAVAVLACIGPARRASRVAPQVALRAE